jgi:DNA helicase-4
VFVDEFLHPEQPTTEVSYTQHRHNSGKRWTPKADKYLLNLHREGKSVKYIAQKMGRSRTSIVIRLGKLNG